MNSGKEKNNFNLLLDTVQYFIQNPNSLKDNNLFQNTNWQIPSSLTHLQSTTIVAPLVTSHTMNITLLVIVLVSIGIVCLSAILIVLLLKTTKRSR